MGFKSVFKGLIHWYEIVPLFERRYKFPPEWCTYPELVIGIEIHYLRALKKKTLLFWLGRKVSTVKVGVHS